MTVWINLKLNKTNEMQALYDLIFIKILLFFKGYKACLPQEGLHERKFFAFFYVFSSVQKIAQLSSFVV
ncbi:hypothetical protein SAMN05421813_11278 [Daejeonella rubra]|uniref:Uncharacterized protein n=1 Tax=Daejeonella rubra TaxID=990371 RepID=A0A1G9TAM8_9SPHI|nr:hypothetical protein SAMN05421813_11278 [Daejeonella rubra]